MVRDTAKDKSTAGSKASSSFSSEDVGRVFELSGVAFHLVPPYSGLLVILNQHSEWVMRIIDKIITFGNRVISVKITKTWLSSTTGCVPVSR